MPTRNIPAAEAGPAVADLMLRDPRTVTSQTTVAEARGAFANPRERMLLVTDDGRFTGAVPRALVTDDLDAAMTLGSLLDAATPRVAPGDSAGRALELLEADQSERLPVVEADGTLVGLVCFNRNRGVFCVDG
jgi:CBS domain-containing protein